MRNRFQFRHVNELTGLFVLLVFAGAAVALYVAARSQHWFAARIEYQLQLPETGASGLRPGNDVVVLGLPAGLVKNVRVSQSGGLDALISIRRDFAPFIRSDTTATIKKIYGVAGDSYVELTRGTQGEPLPEGATIPSEASEELPSVMERLVEDLRGELVPMADQASTLLEEWAELGRRLNQSSTSLDQGLERFNHIMAKLEAGEGSAGRLLANEDLVTEAEAILRETRTTLVEAQEVLQGIREGTEPLSAISQAVEAETRDLPGLVVEMHEVADETRRLIEALQRHWLVRNYVEPTAPGGRIPPEQIRETQP